MKIAFQGELGAFSQQAIRQLLGPRAEPAPYQRFDEVFAALRGKKVDAAVLPIENTLHGSVHENYDLLLRYDFEITAETSVRIVHNLIAPPGVTFERMHQPPQALFARTMSHAPFRTWRRSFWPTSERRAAVQLAAPMTRCLHLP